MPINKDTPDGDFTVQLAVPQDLILKQFNYTDNTMKQIALEKRITIAEVVYDIKNIDD